MTPPPAYGQVLREYGIFPKKRLGQHFMIDPALLQAIARLMIPEEGPWVAVEIGAGIGTLTREIARRARRVYALEMDKDLAPAIEKTSADLSNLQVIWGDALDFDLTGESVARENPGSPLILCGNLPYYVTSEVLYSALVKRCQWTRMAFVVQEEVGERMAGPAGTRDFGRLSLWCQYRARVVVEKRISKGSFVPRPDVGSCLVTLQMKPEFPLTPQEEGLLDSVSRAVFSKRRKTLQNGLREIVPDREALARLLSQAEIDANRRPEDLLVEEFVRLVKTIALESC
ncbi:MAG: 16S rRNA (adenine(1518)-N(6)/adenine(1519)-N(6))-dimethyltransferase RsmA [Bacillota bacterium]